MRNSPNVVGTRFTVAQVPVFQVELRTVAVAPGLGRYHFDLLGSRGLTQPQQCFCQNFSLGGELVLIWRVLVMAAAAAPESIAAGVDALRRGFEYFERARVYQPRFFPLRRRSNPFARQHEGREHHASVQASESIAAIDQLFYDYFEIPSDALLPCLLPCKHE